MSPSVTAVPELLAEWANAGGCEVEIGCGNGHFLTSYAVGRPDTLLIGIDIKAKRCGRAREKALKRGLRNVQILHGAAELFLRDLPPRSVDAFHIYFPDPWPKSRHRKRRFFTMENLRAMHRCLRDGGRVHFGTDFFDYYLQAKVLIALHGGFRLDPAPAPEAVLTSIYGQKYSGTNKTIRIFSAIRMPSPQAAFSSSPQATFSSSPQATFSSSSQAAFSSSPEDQGKQDEDQGNVHQHIQRDQRH